MPKQQTRNINLPEEFSLINDYFAPLAHPKASFGLTDDAAQMDNLVYTTDMIIEAVHFLPADPPETVGRKALRVNLSDLAAKGAKPIGYLMAISLPGWIDSQWMQHFHDGLAADQALFDVALLGGDTVHSDGPLSISITAIGRAPKGGMIRRSGAQPGDAIAVTGAIGDGWLGLQARLGRLTDASGTLIAKYQMPEPRLTAGSAFVRVATASADVSDGLLADALKIAKASQVKLCIDAVKVPLSDFARQWIGCEPSADPISLWTGGDDYELIICLPSKTDFATLSANAGVALSVIGHVEMGDGIELRSSDGANITPQRLGYQHGR